MALSLTADQVLGWRLRRQQLDPPGSASAVEIVRRLAGVHAQVASAAALGVAVRQARPTTGAVANALTDRKLVKTWAMRGTLHLLAAEDAPAFLALMAAGRSWERGSWVKAFGVDPAGIAALAAAVEELLDGAVLTREELVSRLMRRKRFARMEEALRSGWGSLLKPLAWQGHLCFGPAQAARVTFASPRTWIPGWSGIPASDAAAEVAIPSYLGAHGPATPETFDRWLTRGGTRKAILRGWFSGLGDAVTGVEVDGSGALARTEDLEDLAASTPSTAVRLLPGLDHYLLGPGTQDEALLAPARRKDVSKAAGWIAPIVVAKGRFAGTWTVDAHTVELTWFPEAGRTPRKALIAEATRLGEVVGRELAMQMAAGP